METALALFGIVILPLIVVFFLPRKKTFFDHGAVRGFGLGVYLMLVGVLLTEAMEEGSVSMGIFWMLAGIAVSLVIGILFKEFHHHHNVEDSDHAHNQASTGRILVSDFFHNIVDGLAIIAGFAINPTVGGISFLGVLGHQIIQQAGQHILLVHSGINTKKAMVISFFVALSVFIAFAVDGREVEAMLLALSAGIVAWKVWADLVNTQWDKKTITGFVAGALVLAIILLSVPHSH